MFGEGSEECILADTSCWKFHILVGAVGATTLVVIIVTLILMTHFRARKAAMFYLQLRSDDSRYELERATSGILFNITKLCMCCTAYDYAEVSVVIF